MLTANRVRTLLDALHGTWDPVGDLQRSLTCGQFQPRVYRNEKDVLIELDLPGHTADEVEVQVEKNRLSVGLKSPTQSGTASEKYKVRERTDFPGRAEFEFPFPLHENLVDVLYQNGVVRVTVAQPAEEQRKQLTVRQG